MLTVLLVHDNSKDILQNHTEPNEGEELLTRTTPLLAALVPCPGIIKGLKPHSPLLEIAGAFDCRQGSGSIPLMDKLKGLADLIIICYTLFYIGLSIGEHNYILAILCGLVSILAYNHLVRLGGTKGGE